MLGACKRLSLQDVITLRSFVGTLGNNSSVLAYENSSNLSSRSHSTAVAELRREDDVVANPFRTGGGGTLPGEQQLLVEVGVLGVPNAGKSTLTNALAGTKISAVSDKTNTTVRSRLGAFTAGATQVVLFDTPGIISPSSGIGMQQMRRVESAWKTASQCDVLLFVLDAHRQLTSPDPRVLRLVESLGGSTVPGLSSDITLPPIALVLNKVDNVRKEQRSLMLPLAEQFKAMAKFDDIFWVSALRGHGVEELKEYLLARGTRKAWTVPGDASTDASELDVAAEIVREKIFRAYYKELPYEIRVVPINLKILADGSTRIEIEIHVERDSLRKIVVGKNGAAIGSVGIAARTELEKLWKTRVHLFLKNTFATQNLAIMDANQAKAVAAKNNNKLIAGGVVAAVLGYYWYKKRQGDVANIGDAASKTGAATGRALERAGQDAGSPGLKEEGRGFQAKK